MDNVTIEYQEIVARLEEENPELLERIRLFASDLSEDLFAAVRDEQSEMKIGFLFSLFAKVRESDTIKVALSWIGQRSVAELCAKNAILLLGRFLAIIEQFDAVASDEKVQLLIDCLISLSGAISRWTEEQVHALSHCDKKERKKRRDVRKRDVRDAGRSIFTQASAAFQHIEKRLLPNGIDSIFLPAGSHFFSNWLEDIPEKVVQAFSHWFCENCLAREKKMHWLFVSYSALYTHLAQEKTLWVFDKDDPSIRLLSTRLEPAVLPMMVFLCPPALSKLVSFIPKSTVAEKLLQCLCSCRAISSLRDTSLSAFSRLCKGSGVHDEAELLNLIDRIAHDEPMVRACIQRLWPQETGPLPQDQSFLSLLSYGLQVSAKRGAVDNILQSVPWQEEIGTVLHRVRAFVGSMHFDRWFIEWIGRIGMTPACGEND